MVSFANPPIHAVVLATNFKPPLVELRNEHIGLFGSRVKDRYPEVMVGAPYLSELGHSERSHGSFPMPRYSFRGTDHSSFINIQRDAFVFDWHRQQDDPYPGFEQYVLPTYKDVSDRFYEFIKDELGIATFSIALCELTYIDIVPKCEYWQSAVDTKNVVPSFALLEANMNSDEDTEFNYSVRAKTSDTSSVQTTVRVDSPQEQSEPPELIIEITTSDRSPKSSMDDIMVWLQHAHQIVSRCFLELTSDEIQRNQWGRGEFQCD